ncbi:MAG: type II secretion system GspH family protein [Armatimonadetes bacterium]|nr:type II secretion system GspH family protein [Armatimonadota bacterium]
MMNGHGQPGRTTPGFTLIELLVVIAVIAMLAALLAPVLINAKLGAKVARVHSDLRQIAIAIDAYKEDCKGLPPVRESCMYNSAVDYYDLPKELYQMRYLPISRMLDPFNTVRTQDGRDQGRAYKYLAIGWGYSNNSRTSFAMWIPKDYPISKQDCALYYMNRGRIYRYPERKPWEAPVIWAVWSVGPAGDPGWQEAGLRKLPVPRSEWYPYNPRGIIVRLSDGRKSP